MLTYINRNTCDMLLWRQLPPLHILVVPQYL